MAPSLHSPPYIFVLFCICVSFGCSSAAQSVTNIQIRSLNSPSQCSSPTVAADPDIPFGLVFASCDDGIIAINGTQVWTVVPSAVSGCPTPRGVAVHAGFLYATCLAIGGSPNTPTVIRVNFTDRSNWERTTLATYGQCVSPSQLDIDRNSGLVYVSCWNSVIMLNGTKVSTIIPRTVCYRPMVVSAVTRTHGGDGSDSIIYVGCAGKEDQPSRLLSFNPSTKVVSSVADISAHCQTPMATAADLKSGILYVVCFGDTFDDEGSIIGVRGSDVSTVISGKVCPHPVTAAFDPVSGFIFCNCGLFKTMAFNPAAPISSMTTLSNSECENVRSMELVPQRENRSAFRDSPTSQFSLLVACKNSAAIELISGDIISRSIASVDVILG